MIEDGDEKYKEVQELIKKRVKKDILGHQQRSNTN